MVRRTSSKAPRSTRRSIGNVGSPPCAATRPLWDSGSRLSPPSKLEPAAVKYQPEETSPNLGRGEIPRRSWSKDLNGTGRTPQRSGSSLGATADSRVRGTTRPRPPEPHHRDPACLLAHGGRGFSSGEGASLSKWPIP